jgi:hypothetical protein
VVVVKLLKIRRHDSRAKDARRGEICLTRFRRSPLILAVALFIFIFEVRSLRG